MSNLSDSKSDKDIDSALRKIPGLSFCRSTRSVTETVSKLREVLGRNSAIKVFDAVDHQASAARVDQSLRATTLQMFGNAGLGTRLMQVNQLAGLDLPQKILVWEAECGSVFIAFNSADYLQQRHSLMDDEDAESALEKIAGALAGLASQAAGVGGSGSTPAAAHAVKQVAPGKGIVTVNSTRDMDTTYRELLAAIDQAEPLQLVAELDHEANARRNHLDLRPTRLVVFGNPKVGTPLMQKVQMAGIDLPQKMLVFENAEGEVVLAYNDPAFVAQRHGINAQDELQGKISSVLEKLANQAAGVETA